ncbi:MAG: TOBE domain-containing protein, partial [Tolumonas sp.]|nr:TOBE domain-containing protein [Tolumonas sp.]
GENNRLQGVVESIDNAHCLVRMPDCSQIKALSVNVAGRGEQTTLSIRPERILLGAASQNCDNIVQGQVKEFIYLGDHIRLCIHTCGSSDFIVKMPVSQFDPSIKIGDKLSIGWQKDHVRALDMLD